ncbi:MAG: 4Fe-4S binding protein [Planctomycetota bacterium]
MSALRAAIAREAPIAGDVLAHADARATLAQAMGQCEAGLRVTAVVAGADLGQVADLLAESARRLLPLVVRTDTADGEDGLSALAETGAALLLSRDADELPRVHLLGRLLAERALVPVVVAGPGVATPVGGKPLPGAALDLLGDAADFVPSATPAQEQWFGAHRRRVVRWFDLERPVLRGQECDPDLRTLQRAGRAPFVLSPVAALLQQAVVDVERSTGAAWTPVRTRGAEKAEVLVVALDGAAAATAEALAERVLVERRGKPRVGSVVLGALRPFPDDWMSLLRRKAAVVVLAATDGGLAGEPPLLREVRAALQRAATLDARRPWPEKELPRLHAALCGLGGAAPDVDDLAAGVQACLDGKAPPLFYLGVEFAPLHGRLRKRVVLHEALRRAHPGLDQLGIRTHAPAATPPVPSAPLRVPVPAQAEATHDNLARHFDVVGAAALEGLHGELAPDPYLTAGSAPALSSLFRGNRGGAELPIYDPAACTGCGACWASCPDGALLPTVLPAGDLLEAGMRRARSSGATTEALRPVLGRLVKAWSKALAADAPGATTPRDSADNIDAPTRTAATLRAAATSVLAKVDAERRAVMETAADALATALAPLPLTCTEPFFHRAERERPGTGDLLGLVVDADACKGCGLCVTVCAAQALGKAPRDDQRVKASRAAASLWRELPDTQGSVIAATKALPEPGLLPALELARSCLLALAPGDDAEPGSGARLAARSVLALAEAHLQPKLQEHLHDLDDLGTEFGTRIRELLAGALPVGDLDALHEGLATLGMGAVALSTLASRLDQASERGRVDTAKLQRLVETARAVADLRFRTAQARTGRGRARAGLILAGPTARALAGRFPWNPFGGPAVLDATADFAVRAIGLLQGMLAALADDFAMLRRAKALLQGGAPGPRTLSWTELTAGERALCPPLLVMTDAATLAQGGLAALSVALATDLPIKVILLAEHAPDARDPQVALLALAHRHAFVLQTSIAHRDHLADGVLAALAHPGPALVHVLAPSPSARQAASDTALVAASEAVGDLAFPLLRYDPGLPGAFGEKLSLAGNPETSLQDEARVDPERLGAWRTLQELAGVRTPFTQQVQARAAAAVAAAHRQELATLAAQHAAELGRVQKEVEAELLARVQRNLGTLAGGRRP